MRLSIVLLVLCIFALTSAVRFNRVNIASVDSAPNQFVQLHNTLPNEVVSFKILLKQQNLDLLDKKFWEVSTPDSPYYGKFMNIQDINAFVAPPADDVNQVINWLKDNHISKNEMIVDSNVIQVRTSSFKASKLFDTQFAHYISARTQQRRIRVTGTASIPFQISNKIDFVLGLTDFIEDGRMEQSMRTTAKQVEASSATITPAFIKKFYGIPADQIGTNGQNYQSIAAFQDYFASGALSYFDKQFGIDASTVRVNKVGTDCLSGGCDQMESDLDIQYITAIGNNVSTLFLSSGNGEWVLDWATAIQKYNPLPMVASISYGWAEIEQCEITNDCTTLGIDAAVYIERTNTEFQKLGLAGLSILVSSGDDGAPSFYGASGNCPLDYSKYCPLGGCAHTTTSCGSITITSSNGTVCYFPGGSGSNGCQQLLQNQDYADGINKFVESNSACGVAIEQDSQQNYHIYSKCQCSKLKTLSNTDVGFKITGYTFNQNGGSVLLPDYPTSSPYVTSVGATQILTNNQEIVCSTDTGAIITGGGGFASLQPQPAYQSAAVSAYLSNPNAQLPPSFAFNSSNRAYPDITLVGHAYEIAVTKTQTSDQCPCQITSVDGTSCSSPTTAGMISLINDKLLNAGSTQLGFLNPLLYQAYAEQPNVFNDILVGTNKCNRAYCCLYGYSAIKGYDPASGLGSLQFSNFEQYALSKKI